MEDDKDALGLWYREMQPHYQDNKRYGVREDPADDNMGAWCYTFSEAITGKDVGCGNTPSSAFFDSKQVTLLVPLEMM